jgi:hypothetical protein
MRLFRLIVTTTALLGLVLATLSLAPTASRADVEAGWKAYAAGDYVGAIREWQPLAEKGNRNAAFGLGMVWQITGEPRRALRWYEQAAKAGMPEAQVLLGTLYAKGIGAPADLVRAYAWLSLATAQQHPNASLVLSTLAAEMTAEEIEAGKSLGAELGAQ